LFPEESSIDRPNDKIRKERLKTSYATGPACPKGFDAGGSLAWP